MYAVRYDGDYEGQVVVDDETRQPIEGVVVLGTWEVLYPDVGGGSHRYFDAKETVTDKNGDFSISGEGLRVLSNLEPMSVVIFKAGYKCVEFKWDKDAKTWHEYDRGRDRLIIRLEKLTMEVRKKHDPPSPHSDSPFKKVRLMLKEIDKDSIERGLEPRGTWKRERIE